MNACNPRRAVMSFHPWCLLLLGLLPAMFVWSAYIPQQNLDPATAGVRLDSSYQSDAWLVYTYDINTEGRVINTVIQRSNGVLEVEQAVLQQINAMRFKPAMRDGKPVVVSADPVIFTWILDKPREMSVPFGDRYRQAWALYTEKNYEAAAGIAKELKDYSGRNALEETKARILAASLASRTADEATELQQLSRVVQLQSLALNNNFSNLYVSNDQYLQILKRIQTLQLNGKMLADAGKTLLSIQGLGAGSEIAIEASRSYREAEVALHAMDDVTIQGELQALYPNAPGAWKAGLFRDSFSVSDVRGRVGAVYLVCSGQEKRLPYPARGPWQIPPGWSECEIDVSGEAGASLVLHQHAPG